MSLTTITQASRDPALHERIVASAWQVAMSSPTYGDTVFGRNVLAGGGPIVSQLSYPVAVDTEAAYESAVNSGNTNPGGDPSVITDAAITSSVQTNWPADPAPPPT
jgi:hypothetical protein